MASIVELLDAVDAYVPVPPRELGRPVALEPGLGFAVREGNRTVAAGTVTGLLD